MMHRLTPCDSIWFIFICNFVVLQLFENSGVALMADSQYDAQTRIQVLLEYLHERELDLEDMAEQKRMKLEQCLQLRAFETEARQVRTSWTVSVWR